MPLQKQPDKAKVVKKAKRDSSEAKRAPLPGSTAAAQPEAANSESQAGSSKAQAEPGTPADAAPRRKKKAKAGSNSAKATTESESASLPKTGRFGRKPQKATSSAAVAVAEAEDTEGDHRAADKASHGHPGIGEDPNGCLEAGTVEFCSSVSQRKRTRHQECA